MRFISATLRNCRVHRELKVEFDPARTVIGGLNETGKSTLIEAVHRALFLKAKGSTEHHRALVSSLHTGHPEVELTFAADGTTYVLKKRFGANGTTSLAPSNGLSLSGDAAESELARLLSVEVGLTGKAMGVQWAHLWVWQGQSGDDPSGHATTQHAALLQRLQDLGGAAALQSELDARVAKHFAEAKDQTYTQAGRAKAGSALELTESAVTHANAELARAQERVNSLSVAADGLESASRTVAETTVSLRELERQRQETGAKTQRLVELRQQETEQRQATNAAEVAHTALKEANEQILEARGSIAKLEQGLQPTKEKVKQLEAAKTEAKSKAATAEQTYRTATESVRTAHLRRDLASAHVRLFEAKADHIKLTEKDKKVAKRRQTLAEQEGQLAKLPKVDKVKLQKLQKMENELSNASAALQAMATGLEVVAADKPVKAGGVSIKKGEKRILTEDTVVVIGSAVRLRIQPGGGVSLTDAHSTELEARTELRKALDALGLPSVQEALQFHAQREELSTNFKTTQAELKGMGAEELAEELAQALTEFSAAKAEVARLVVLVQGLEVPPDKDAAKALTKALERAFRDAEDQETAAKAARDLSATVLESANEKLQAETVVANQQNHQLIGLKAQLELRLRTHGEDATRAIALLQSQATKTAAEVLLKATTDAITALQPVLIEEDRVRIKSSIDKQTEKHNTARTNMAVAQNTLRPDGNEDPQAALATSDAKARSANEHRDSVLRKAQAVTLLDTLFQEEQRLLSSQFTQPLADKVSGYLRCIFGARALAQVELEDGQFGGLRLFRPEFGGAHCAFLALSGGAKEQVAAAVRLAMAEVLAPDHNGCLPVVFDDAFTNSDPERVQPLQRMLYLAATRGLQVIVLTCNPADYAGLGGHSITLSRALTPQITPPPV